MGRVALYHAIVWRGKIKSRDAMKLLVTGYVDALGGEVHDTLDGHLEDDAVAFEVFFESQADFETWLRRCEMAGCEVEDLT